VSLYEDAQEEALRRLQAMAAAGASPAAAPPVAAPRALPRATRKASAGGTLSGRVQPGEENIRRGLELMSAEDDYTAASDFARQRSVQGEDAMLNAIAASVAGRRFEPLQGAFLKRALAAQDPMKVGTATIGPDGTVLRDPSAERMRNSDRLIRVGEFEMGLDARRQAREQQAADRQETRMLRQSMAAAGGGSRGFQQGAPMALPDGTVVQSVFDPQRGYMYQTPGGMQPVPADARPATASMGAPLYASAYNKAVSELSTEKASINKLDRYLETVGDANSGMQRWADGVAANARTLFGSKRLTPDQLAAMKGPAQLQALLGMFREDIVGPGVMTEYDAQRVLQALGGNFNALQNPQFVREILGQIRESKTRHVGVLESQVNYSAPFFPGVYNGGAPAAPQAPANQPSAPGGGRRVVVDY